MWSYSAAKLKKPTQTDQVVVSFLTPFYIEVSSLYNVHCLTRIWHAFSRLYSVNWCSRHPFNLDLGMCLDNLVANWSCVWNEALFCCKEDLVYTLQSKFIFYKHPCFSTRVFFDLNWLSLRRRTMVNLIQFLFVCILSLQVRKKWYGGHLKVLVLN